MPESIWRRKVIAYFLFTRMVEIQAIYRTPPTTEVEYAKRMQTERRVSTGHMPVLTRLSVCIRLLDIHFKRHARLHAF